METSPYTVREDPDYRAPTSGNLGGWYRALDLAGRPVRLHDGLLSRDGWYLLDDTHTALLQDEPPGFAARPGHAGAYQDGYLFGYGHDYARGLRDLRVLTGAAPLLPRSAFGVWFSRYFAYRQADYPPLVERFRAERVPVDVLMVDTDFKSPHAWNGWDWLPDLFPDPRGFLAWAHSEDLDVSLNIHPSITTDDPRLAEAERRAGGALPDDPTGVRCRTFVSIGDAYGRGVPGAAPGCRVFDWTRAGDQDAYFSLHEPFERDGADFWWLDYCCDESYALAPGLTQDAWINHLYALRSTARRSRWPVLSRIGASVFDPDEPGGGVWAEHRNAIHFTGDARPTWEMLDFQTAFTAAEGNVGIPYVSHDIGGFGSITSDGLAGRHLADDLYVRWVQSGTFQPILRLHSDHGDRLPWDYPGKAQQVATEFLRLRGALVPYLYTLARRAYDSGLPMTRRAYLRWPGHDDAYSHDRQYLLGPDLLVAPVGASGDPATKEVWFPPGRWIDIFTRQVHRGPAVKRLSVPLERMPVFARAGTILPLQEYREGNTTPPTRLIVEAYRGSRGRFTLYEDQGDGLAYRRGRFARTRISQRRTRRATALVLGRARGTYPGRPRRRSYELRVIGVARPRAVTIGGRRLRRAPGGAARGWSYDASRRTVVVRTGRLPTARATRVVLRTVQ
jgi:alpha-glucosidase (family GH31 glycosyl hydrolase)